MNQLPDTLQPLRFPLWGSRLIEASAGTGKTFTIAALYLRLVLGHGAEAAFHRPLTPPEILVVTFTDAATKELRDRIRARLAEAAQAFLVPPEQVLARPPGQDLLHDLRADFPSAAWPACARSLRLAAEWMDEAAVSTIHGWCYRMLREHAFDSDSLFTQTLQTDQRELQAEVLRDHWRSHVATLGVEDARTLRAWWATPDALGADLLPLLPLCDELPAGRAPAAALHAARELVEERLDALKTPWRGEAGWAVALAQCLDEVCAAKWLKMPSRKAWCQRLRDWAEGDDREPALTDTAWERFTPEGLAAAWSGDEERLQACLQHPAWAALFELKTQLQGLPDGREDLLAHAAHWVSARLAQEQLRRAEMGFNELLTRLDAALQGPNGPRLAALIRAQFPVALIDEFQDTDPLQYRIFDAVYGVAANDPETALVLIGDPKQAIYAFRGADIHTYLRARADTAGRHATLGTNFRSTQAMVQAVNQVFEQAEQRAEGDGAFLFRGPQGNALPFLPVAAQGRSERWVVDGKPAPALVGWHFDTEATLGAGVVQQALATACACEIVRLLQAGQAGKAGFEREGAWRSVRPGDVAVLVNSGREAAAVRQALRVRGVRSVYLSDKESVFRSPVAADLQRWLQACAEPEDERCLRAALATATLALPFGTLDELNHDELAWESRVLQFREWRQCWRQQGVLPMLRQLMQAFGVPQRLLAAGDERRLTDLLHLAELLQQASATLDGEHALVRWLAEQRADDEAEGETRRLRLESDADLVQVVTVHKSKGLEYPLVFLPFASHFRSAKPDDLPLRWHDASGQRRLSWHPDAEALACVDRERLGEDLRKLYVALTRARFATWVGVAPLAAVERGALGYLLGGGAPLAPADLPGAWQRWCDAEAAIAGQPLPTDDGARLADEAALRAWRAPPALPRAPRAAWWVASYSALRRTEVATQLDDEGPRWDEPQAQLPLASVPTAPHSAAEDAYVDSQAGLADAGDGSAAEVPPTDAEPQGVALHGFPRGAAPGTFLHQLLEWAGRQGFARLVSDPALQADADDLVARRCNLSGWSHWTEVLRAWLRAWLRTPWDLTRLVPGAAPVAPAGLVRSVVEMEFWFAAQAVDSQQLDQLICQHSLDAAARPPLGRQRLNGMLKGFIDLVFEHEGRYFIADHKSNWLGPTDAHYTSTALREAVLHHRYDVQYLLYTLALHRLLKTRLVDYDYDRHVGGVVYLFLRGHAAPGQGLYLDRPARTLVEALDALFAGQAAPAVAGLGESLA